MWRRPEVAGNLTPSQSPRGLRARYCPTPYLYSQLTTPKQPSASRRRDWYPYYAGFTEDFVEAVLEEDLAEASSVVDPWSGSGTTTVACTRNRVRSVGIDVNPALTIIARARLTPRCTGTSLLPLGRQLLDLAQKARPRSTDRCDLLARWMRPSAAARLRAVQDAIHSALTDSESDLGSQDIERRSHQLPQLANFFYCVLFATARDLLRRFRTTNPMWLRSPASHRHRIAPTWPRLSEVFLERLVFLRDRLTIEEDGAIHPELPFRTGSAAEMPFDSGQFDAALTSPPYATRIDYVKGTMPELAVLGADEAYVGRLRARTTGSPVVAGRSPSISLNSDHAQRILETIREHPSKGSAGYYFPWMSRYLTGLQAGLDETARIVKPGGRICVVVQDSYYKESRIALQQIVIEMMTANGRTLTRRRDFAANRLRSRMNPRALRHVRVRHNTESLLVFGK